MDPDGTVGKKKIDVHASQLSYCSEKIKISAWKAEKSWNK